MVDNLAYIEQRMEQMLSKTGPESKSGRWRRRERDSRIRTARYATLRASQRQICSTATMWVLSGSGLSDRFDITALPKTHRTGSPHRIYSASHQI
ncbi:hypothetical protein CALCODRAFT_491638 [Calocera cornea HHB12733]|uniref:Uncharacterized protein n=1 Tax=Calocera cornea HHB12733 TaxID=1353952 RepID=A0A165IUI2_9BASI|nr:hypothetical protein CALCODRAFT_491638 [Calocera cornea HHB12733]